MKGEVLLREVVGLYKLIQLIDAGRWEIENILVISQWEMGDYPKIGRLPMGDGRFVANYPISRWEMGDSDPTVPPPFSFTGKERRHF